jgi:type IV pilus assembly protein PilQ
VSKRKQIITSIALGSAVVALSAAHVNAATRTQIDTPAPSNNLLVQTPPAPPAPTQQPLVPNPKVTIDGVPATPGVGLQTPTMPRAVAPPTGDISVSNIDATIPQINLDSKKLYSVTATQSARELLRQIAFEANLNVVDSDSAVGADGKPALDKVSVRFRNEPIQNVFNYVLQLSGLEASRVGNTIFVGTKLPDSVQETVVRTLRMNQVSVEAAASFLATQGAEARLTTFTEKVETVNTGGAAGSLGSSSSFTSRTRTATIVPLTVDLTKTNSPIVLKGLAVSTDERLNSITLIGTPRKVAMATAILTRLDARRRQVALNVKIVDINLSNINSVKSSLSFRSGDTSVGVNGGAASVNFGTQTPATFSTSGVITNGITNAINPSNLLTLVQAQITNGTGKILTDPTLVVQEGQKSTIDLTQDVFGGFKINSVAGTGATTSTREPIIKQAGLSLDLLVNRIDDNGFVTVAIAPTVSSLANSITTADGDIALLQSRKLNSGEVRLRDGQTLILSGIIQESDRSSVSKVPILGDIPLLGILFRSTSKTKERTEVVVLVTPQILNDNKGQTNYTPGVDARLLMGK